MIDLVKQPWHWAVAGVFIGLTVPTLLLLGNKRFGISSSLRHICAMCLPAKIPFFQYNWKKEIWNLFFVTGTLIGGFIAAKFLASPDEVSIATKTKEILLSYGISDYKNLMPTEIFAVEQIFTLKGLFFFVIGGLMVGFGTRYAGGCTSGHSITGLATLQWPSLVATICFMTGGFFSANILLPFIFKIVQ
jgi:uncharacterized protein